MNRKKEKNLVRRGGGGKLYGEKFWIIQIWISWISRLQTGSANGLHRQTGSRPDVRAAPSTDRWMYVEAPQQLLSCHATTAYWHKQYVANAVHELDEAEELLLGSTTGAVAAATATAAERVAETAKQSWGCHNNQLLLQQQQPNNSLFKTESQRHKTSADLK